MNVFSFILHHAYKTKKNKVFFSKIKKEKTLKNMYDLNILDSKTTMSFKN